MSGCNLISFAQMLRLVIFITSTALVLAKVSQRTDMHVAWGWVFAPVWVLEACISYHALYHIIKKIVNTEESKLKAVGNVTSLAIKRVFRLEIGNTIKPEESVMAMWNLICVGLSVTFEVLLFLRLRNCDDPRNQKFYSRCPNSPKFFKIFIPFWLLIIAQILVLSKRQVEFIKTGKQREKESLDCSK